MIQSIVLLLLGFILLIKASDIFVDSVSSIAENFKVPKIVIALTVASFATSVPELAISSNSVFSHNGDIAIANVIGSNIVNILLILGLTSFVFRIKFRSNTVKKEIPILIAITSLFSLSIVFNVVIKSSYILTWYNALSFLLVFIVFIIYILKLGKNSKEVFRKKPKYGLRKSIIYTVFCVLVIIFASDLVVDSSVFIANYFNISQKIITMTIVVIGTTLPELITTIMAAKKKEPDIVVGNIIGTNIFNIGVVLGLPILFYGGVESVAFNIIDALVVLLGTIFLFIFAKNDKVLSRREGFVMLLLFMTYYLYLIIS